MSSDSIIIPAPSSPPPGIRTTSTPYQLVFKWDKLNCSDRNADITGYLVEFGPYAIDIILYDDVVNQERINVKSEDFSARNLTPGFNYTFKVAAVNLVGIGPFSDLLVISTYALGMSYYAIIEDMPKFYRGYLDIVF